MFHTIIKNIRDNLYLISILTSLFKRIYKNFPEYQKKEKKNTEAIIIN